MIDCYCQLDESCVGCLPLDVIRHTELNDLTTDHCQPMITVVVCLYIVSHKKVAYCFWQ